MEKAACQAHIHLNSAIFLFVFLFARQKLI